MEPMTDEEYVACNGLRCPFCGAENTMGAGQFTVDRGQASQQVFCHECGNAWEDIYKLIGYDVVEYHGETDE